MHIRKIFSPFSALIFGVLFAIFGVSKINPLAAQQQTLKESLFFGKADSPIEVYIFTDWFCPACRKVDPEIDKMLPDVQKNAKVYFIDATVHPESLNFTPYNLSFLVNNKDQYMQIRKAIEGLSEKNKTPSDTDIKNTIKPLGAKLKELSYSDVAVGVKFFKKLVKQFDITQTPTVVVINAETKKGKKFSGSSEITQDNILKGIESLQKKD
jgi:protein-disulfide isomerase